MYYYAKNPNLHTVYKNFTFVIPLKADLRSQRSERIFIASLGLTLGKWSEQGEGRGNSKPCKVVIVNPP